MDIQKFFMNKKEYIVIKPEKTNIIPYFCPHCELLMKDAYDSQYFREYQCCSKCVIRWAEGINKTKWIKEGWRPTKEEVDEMVSEVRMLPFI